MTPRERQCLDAIEAHIQQHRVPPSYAELAVSLGMGLTSKSVVHRLLSSLERQGEIRRDKNRTRSIVVTGGDPFSGVSSDALRAELRRRGELVA